MLRAASGGVLALGSIGRAHGTASAQDLPMATPNALGPAIPPELTEYAADWPAPHGNLAAHRAASTSAITADTIGQL